MNSSNEKNLEDIVSFKTKKLESQDVFLLKYSKFVDGVDMFFGPISEIAKQSDADLIKIIGLATSIIKGVIKIPFVSFYLAKTNDFSALYDWGPKEIFSYAVPFGSFIDILRNYEKITYLHYGLDPFKSIPEERLQTKSYLKKTSPQEINAEVAKRPKASACRYSL